MIRVVLWQGVAAALVAALVASATPRRAEAATAAELERAGKASLELLYKKQSVAKLMAPKARGILVFPSILKAGFMFGGQIGDGVLLKNGRAAGFYNSVAASYGLQAGLQKFGYALFFMNDAALRQLDATHGFELGVGPSIVIVDEGVGRSLTTNTLTSDVYAFIFDQRGVMAGLGIQGSKITKIDK